MKFGSYMEDYQDTYVFGKDNMRAIGKAIFAGAGGFNFLLGLFCIPYTLLGATVGIVGGVGLLIYAFVYFRPKK